MDITLLFWFGMVMLLIGILFYSDVFRIRRQSLTDRLGLGLIITGATLSCLCLFCKCIFWLMTTSPSDYY